MFSRLLIGFSALAFAATALAQTCTPNATRDSAARAARLQQQLLATPVAFEETDLTSTLRVNLHDFKQALIATVDKGLYCNNPEPNRIQMDLAMLLHANRPEKPELPTNESDDIYKPEAKIYGADLRVGVKAVTGQSGLVSVQLTFGILCSNDNILLLYRRTAAGWQKELVWQNPDVSVISDAFGDFFLFTVVPPDVNHSYLVAVAHGFPWCTSTYSKFEVDLLAPAVSGKPQTGLAHTEQGYRREDDSRIKATSDGFELRASTNDLAMQQNIRDGVFRYRTTGGAIERTQPIANNARDFVDEWLQIPWPEAQRWSAEPFAPLKTVHDSFDYKLHPHGDGPTIDTYGPVRACSSAKDVFQIEITSILYALVRQSPTAFTMLSITPQPDPTCTGPDIMKKR